jgi:hypothetical protein
MIINKLLILIILAVIIFFTIDYMYNKYLKTRVNDMFNNINGSYEKFKQLGNLSCTKDYYNNKVSKDFYTNIENFELDENRKTYYKQYLYKILSANKNDQIVKLKLKNSIKYIDLEIIFNNVLDHDKINDIVETDNNHTAIINDNILKGEEIIKTDITKTECKYEVSDNYDNNEYSWIITDINEDLLSFTIKFVNLIDNLKTYNLTINIKEDLQYLYSNNMEFKQLLSPSILNYIKLSKDSNPEIEITSYFVSMILFSDLTVSRLAKYHSNIKNVIENEILADSYDNLKKYGRIQKDINKLENYYKFKKNMEKNYMTYKTLE